MKINQNMKMTQIINKNKRSKCAFFCFIFCIFSAFNAHISSASSSSSLPSTSVQFYRPFEEPVQGQAKLNINKILKGECLQHSKLDKRADAWQCQTDNGAQTFDPCFIKSYIKPELAMCVIAPWKSNVVVIDLKDQVEPPKNKKNNLDSLDMSIDDPWAIRLLDGTYCLKTAQGQDGDVDNSSQSSSLIHGQRIKYTCNNGSFLLGHIQRCELIWKILWLPSRQSNEMKMTEIGKAWY